METSSDLLFNSCLLDVMKWNFSLKQKLHAFLPFRYGLARSMISHDNIPLIGLDRTERCVL